MSDTYWQKFELACVLCESLIELRDVNFHEDGRIRLIGVCTNKECVHGTEDNLGTLDMTFQDIIDECISAEGDPWEGATIQ